MHFFFLHLHQKVGFFRQEIQTSQLHPWLTAEVNNAWRQSRVLETELRGFFEDQFSLKMRMGFKQKNLSPYRPPSYCANVQQYGMKWEAMKII